MTGKLKKRFATHGIPDTFHSDNGPPFSSNEFSAFVVMYEFEHVTSSPEYPQSNGKVENAVKTAKCLMKKLNLLVRAQIFTLPCLTGETPQLKV